MKVTGNMTKSPAEINQLFSKDALRQSWLDVEAALAEVQGEMQIIPQEAALEISKKAHLKYLDSEELTREIKRTKAPIVSLTKQLAAACEKDHGSYVHWGATTQNIIQTGRILQIRKAHQLMRREFGEVLAALIHLAEKGNMMVMAGRTQRRQALPITFGFKVAGWMDEFLRHLERFDQFEPRFFCLQFGGAIGAMQSFGKDGPEISKRLGKKLNLTHLPVPVRSANDFLAEYVSTMALYGTTCSKVAQELYTLMADEFGEVAEGMGKDVIGSSTMPQKINSKVACNIITVAARIRSQMFLAFEGMHSSHEGDAATNKMMSEALDTVCKAAYELTLDMKSLIGELQLKPEAMRQNLDKTNGLIVAENIMMTLAPVLGRQKAHDLLHHAAEISVAGEKNLAEILKSDPAVSANISHEKLDEALDPANYLGDSIKITEETIARVKEVLPKLA